MSIYVMAPALRTHIPDLAEIPGADRGCDGRTMKLVLLGLADSANEDGTDAHPGIRSLAGFAQCHTSTIVRALRGLQHLGAIRRVRRGGGPGRAGTFDVDLDWLQAQVIPQVKPYCAPGARKDGDGASQARNARAPEARNIARPRGALFRPYVHTSAGDLTGDDDSEPVPTRILDRFPHLRERIGGEDPGPATSTPPTRAGESVHSSLALADGTLIPHPDWYPQEMAARPGIPQEQEQER